jgi:hypothetical protein
MATSLYAEEEADFRFRGDTVQVDGAMTCVGTATLSGVVTMTSGITGTLKITGGPTGTNVGLVWTSGAPVLTAGHQFILITAGSTTYRIPVFANA